MTRGSGDGGHAAEVPKDRAELPPHAAGLINALREIGYKLEHAIADLVDNSITAGATRVLIRFIHDGDSGLTSICVVDDGMGMSSPELSDAMQFGAKDTRPLESLGKYGVGLKLASLSHAKRLSVYSRRKGRASGMRWDVDQIARDGWYCDLLTEGESDKKLLADWKGIELSSHGTVVEWSRIDKISFSASKREDTLRRIANKLSKHLGLCFHRFLETSKLDIYIDVQEEGAEPHGIHTVVEALNPFPEHTGHTKYPTMFGIELPDVGRLRAEAHIWPPNSKSSSYKLGGGAAARQGFYIYRNDRLIQAGGWNGLVGDEREPHGSLARVRLELPPRMDAHFSLNVQKAAVTAPPTFIPALQDAAADNGHTFAEYRRAAQQVYRVKDDRALKQLPLVPHGGLPRDLKDKMEQVFAPSVDEYRPVSIEWKKLPPDHFVDFSKDPHKVYLNTLYRDGVIAMSADDKGSMPLIKVLVFALFEEFIEGRMSKKRKNRLDSLNEALCAVAGAAYK